jgi:uncharacterized oxidoreductase
MLNFRISLFYLNTDLGGAGLHTHGEPLDAFADGIFKGLEEGKRKLDMVLL